MHLHAAANVCSLLHQSVGMIAAYQQVHLWVRVQPPGLASLTIVGCRGVALVGGRAAPLTVPDAAPAAARASLPGAGPRLGDWGQERAQRCAASLHSKCELQFQTYSCTRWMIVALQRYVICSLHAASIHSQSWHLRFHQRAVPHD